MKNDKFKWYMDSHYADQGSMKEKIINFVVFGTVIILVVCLILI